MPQSSPFAAATSNAHRAEFAGWELPAHFGDWQAEYRAALEGAALFDCSHHGKLEITGTDAPNFLTNLSTNDINHLPLGAGCLSYFLNAKAKTLFQASIYHVLLDGQRHGLLVDVTPGYHEAFFKHLDRYLISEQVELADRTLAYAQAHLAGPQAKAVLERALGAAMPDLQPFMHMERALGQRIVCHIRRRDLLGVPGYDVVCLNDRADGLWRALTISGATPAGLQAFEVLRVEAALPIYGVDIDENRFVMEIGGAKDAVCYTKGCFIGQEPIVMARDRAGFVNRAFLTLAVPSGATIPAGTLLHRGDDEVGVVTSSVQSPEYGSISLAYVRRGHQELGTILQAKSTTPPTDLVVMGLKCR